MLSSSLQRLVDAARSLPGDVRPAPAYRLATAVGVDAADVDPTALRRRLGGLLEALASRLEPALQQALQRALVAWDAFDEVAVMDADTQAEATAIATAALTLERDPDPLRRTIGIEVRVALQSALGLLDLLERRLATLVRLRVQSADPSLLPDGRPFLDVAAALAEAARGWR